MEAKHADPRELVLKTANQLRGHIELLARIKGELVTKHEVSGTVHHVYDGASTDQLLALIGGEAAALGEANVVEGEARLVTTPTH